MPHLDAGQIHELLDGEISSSELPPIQAHLASCPACRARLDEERTVVAGTDELVALLELPGQRDTTPPMATNPPLRGRWVRDLAWAATVVIAIGLGYAARGTPSLRVVHDTVTVAPAASMTPLAPAAPVVTHELPAKTRAKVVPAAAPTPPAPQPLNAANGAAAAPERRADLAAAKSATAVDSAATPPRTGTLAAAEQMRVAAAAPPTGNRGGGAGRGGGRGGRAAVRVEPIDTISFTEAISRLGGTIRLIEGMVPLRVESQGNRIRVVYPATQGSLVVEQQLIDGKVVFDVVASPGFPADSLLQLRSRVRP